MKYYHKYKEALEDKGYRVDEHGYVWDPTDRRLSVVTCSVDCTLTLLLHC